MASIGDRMKNNYENRFRYYLMRRMPVIIRLDGQAFHTLTRTCDKPFDERFNNSMIEATKIVFPKIQGAKIAYIQSDEISFLLTDFEKLTTDAYFDYNLQKLNSIIASMISVEFTINYGKPAIFDCRAFNIPKEEVCNYFIWRQKDWERNSISMLANAHYSHRELMNKDSNDKHEMLYRKGVNWADLPEKWKNGTILNEYLNDVTRRKEIRQEHFIVMDNRQQIERFLLNGD